MLLVRRKTGLTSSMAKSTHSVERQMGPAVELADFADFECVCLSVWRLKTYQAEAVVWLAGFFYFVVEMAREEADP